MPSSFVTRTLNLDCRCGVITATVVAALVGGCADLPVVETGARPADPDVRVSALAYRSVTGGTRMFRPVEPKGWEELNRQVGPKGN